MGTTARSVLTETGPQALPADGGIADRLLSLTDVARMLMCGVEEARDWLARAKVPCLTLPGGDHRFLVSSVLDVVRAQLAPYTYSATQRDAGEEIARAWERWVIGKGEQAIAKLNEDWSEWMKKMSELRMLPEDYFALPKEKRKQLVRSVQKHPNSLPFTEDAAAIESPPHHATLTTTTRVRGSFLGRKAFE